MVPAFRSRRHQAEKILECRGGRSRKCLRRLSVGGDHPAGKEGLAYHELAPVQLNIGRLVVVHTSVRLPVAILGDKIVQKCLVWVLKLIYEEDFLASAAASG